MLLNKKGKEIIYNAGIESTIEYADKDKVRKKSPRISLNIAPFNLPFIPVEIVSTDVGGIIQSLSFVKSRSTAGGSASVTIINDRDLINSISIPVAGLEKLKVLWADTGVDFRDLFKPMALCQIWVDGYLIMTGYVRSCNRQASPTSPITFTVKIDELGCLYEQNIVSFNTMHYGINQCKIDALDKLLEGASYKTGQSVSDSFKGFVDAFKGSTLAYGVNTKPPYFSGSDGIPLAMRLVAENPPLGCISDNSIVSAISTDSGLFATAGGSSFFDYLRSLVPSPFCELFTESGGHTRVTSRIALGGVTPMIPGMNYIIMRTAPYEIPWTGYSLWNATLYPYTLGAMDLLAGGDYVIVTDDDVMQKDLGMSDQQQYTSFSTYFDGKSGATGGDLKLPPSFAKGGLNPLASGGTRTFGFREFETSIPSTSNLPEKLYGQVVNSVKKKLLPAINVPVLNTLLNVWFRNASKFNEGTIITRGMPYARPGMYLMYLPPITGSNIDNLRDLGLYYIDNVQYDYNIGKVDTTTYSVIRGVPMPMTNPASAKMLFDWDLMPPGSGLFDGDL